MTDTIEETHIQVGLSALAGNPALLHVFRDVVDNPTPDPPYVLVYPVVAWTRDGVGVALDAVQDTITTTFTCHCVGLTPSAAVVVQMQVRSSLLNLRPVIAGRSCGPVKQDDVQPAARDESLSYPVYDAVSIFSFISTG